MTEPTNTEFTSTSNTGDTTDQQQDFGQQLKQARQAAGYSVAEVSDQLKLNTDLIEALESSQLEKLPAATFTQGYLRNYARLLKLPADDIVQAYNRQTPVPEHDLMPTSGIPAQKNSHDAVIKITSYGLLFIGLLLVVLWWQQTGFEWAQNPSEESSGSEPVSLQADAMIEDMNQPVTQADESVTQQVDVEPAEPVEFEAEPLAAVSPSESTEVTPEVIQQPVETNVAPVVNTPAVEEKLVEVIASGEDQLLLRTESESWTEVQDANGNRLFFKLMKQGQEYRITGVAPFRIFLGNAPTVDIQVNGKSVDISNYIRSNNIANVMIKSDASISSSRRLSKPATPTQPAALTQPAVDATESDSSRDQMFDEAQ